MQKAQKAPAAHLNGASTSVAIPNSAGFDFKDWKDGTAARKETHQNVDTASVISMGPQPVNSGSTAKTGLPDFFSQEIFNIVLHNPTTSHQLRRFCDSRFCGENMAFLEKVDRFHVLLDELTKILSEIHGSFTSSEAPKSLNIRDVLLKRINMDIKNTQLTTLPSLELIFQDAQIATENILATDIYPRFVKHQLAASASKALSGSRGKYAGLGDCFCLTDRRVADNPIITASDGFLSVSGYTRSDIIPRNCRFLQGKYTDQASAQRIKEGIEANQETVELLLNYRKTGEPFWNLLYTAPLFNVDGTVHFFLGCQINISTTIISRSDVLRVLSASDLKEEERQDLTTPTAAPEVKSPLERFFKSFRKQLSAKPAPDLADREAGMEEDLLGKIQNTSLDNQKRMFYTAYSKYLVLDENFKIHFFSSGIVEMLLIDPSKDNKFVGSEVFAILTQYSTYLPKDFKVNVKSSIRMGRALSLDVNLVTRRSMMSMKGHEKFASHWTPLKGENAAVKFVVVCFASYQQ